MNSATPPSPNLYQRIQQAWLDCGVLACVAALIAQLLIGLNSDLREVLHQSAQLLSGATPYVDYVTATPPLLHIIYAPAALLHNIGLPAHASLWLWLFLLEIGSLHTCWHILQSTGRNKRGIITILVALVLALNVIAFQHQSFGQPEHLMALLCMPWFLLCSPLVDRSQVAPRTRYNAAIAAAIGFMLKPYFVLYYLATIFYVGGVWQQRRWREHHIMWGMGALYILVVKFLFSAYGTQVWPLMWYTLGSNSWTLEMRSTNLRQTLGSLWPVWAGALACFAFPRPKRQKPMLYVALLLGVSSLCYLVGGGWYYTLYPILALGFLAGVYAASVMLPAFASQGQENLPARILGSGVVLGMAILLLYPAYNRAYNDMIAQSRTGNPWANILPIPQCTADMNRIMPPKSSFVYLGTSLRALTLEQQERRSLGRYDSLWPLKEIATKRWQIWFRTDPTDRVIYDQIWPPFIQGITADIATQRPDFIVVDVSPRQPPMEYGFNIVGFLNADKNFQQVMKLYDAPHRAYHCNDTVQENCAYDIYPRKKI